MTILLCGGGTGGHITPLLAVANELKHITPGCRIVYVGEKHGRFANLLDAQGVIDELHYVHAGKFRRYHNETWFKRLTDFKTIVLNIRDGGRLVAGLWESFWLLKRVKPDVVFIKGGFVGVPVGLCSALLKIPFITHDSDTLPGLANRLIGRWAAIHATALPTDFYAYPPHKSHFVGIPMPKTYRHVDVEQKNQYRRELNLPEKGRVLLITGGSLGALRLNYAVEKIVPELLAKYDNLIVIHQIGVNQNDLYQSLAENFKKRLIIHAFITDLYRYSGAADVVITRAGATTLAELALQGRACVVVPNADLTGGHQLTNAKHLKQHDAALIVTEVELKTNEQALKQATVALLEDSKIRAKLAGNLHLLAKDNAANVLANLLLQEIGNK